MSFKQEIYLLMYIFIMNRTVPIDWRSQLRDDVLDLLKSDIIEDFRILFIRRALPYSSKRIRFYNDFLKFVDNYLKL